LVHLSLQDTEKAGKRQKRTEKPEAPSYPKSAFMKWQNDECIKIKKACPLIKLMAIQALISDKWAKITKSEKDAMNAASKVELAEFKQSPEYLEYLEDLEE